MHSMESGQQETTGTYCKEIIGASALAILIWWLFKERPVQDWPDQKSPILRVPISQEQKEAGGMPLQKKQPRFVITPTEETLKFAKEKKDLPYLLRRLSANNENSADDSKYKTSQSFSRLHQTFEPPKAPVTSKWHEKIKPLYSKHIFHKPHETPETSDNEKNVEKKKSIHGIFRTKSDEELVKTLKGLKKSQKSTPKDLFLPITPPKQTHMLSQPTKKMCLETAGQKRFNTLLSVCPKLHKKLSELHLNPKHIAIILEERTARFSYLGQDGTGDEGFNRTKRHTLACNARHKFLRDHTKITPEKHVELSSKVMNVFHDYIRRKVLEPGESELINEVRKLYKYEL